MLTGQQKATGSQSSSKLLAANPVGGAEVVKSALKANTSTSKGQSKAAVAANANSSGSTSGSTSSETSALSGSSSDSTIAASYKLMEMNQDFNLQYLNLQENMQAESRQFTAMSNVSKTKSDTAKNSLSNVK